MIGLQNCPASKYGHIETERFLLMSTTEADFKTYINEIYFTHTVSRRAKYQPFTELCHEQTLKYLSLNPDIPQFIPYMFSKFFPFPVALRPKAGHG